MAPIPLPLSSAIAKATSSVNKELLVRKLKLSQFISTISEDPKTNRLFKIKGVTRRDKAAD
jgi:hypothetical protein